MNVKKVSHPVARSVAHPPEAQQRLLTVEPPPDVSERKQVCYLGTMSPLLNEYSEPRDCPQMQTVSPGA